MENYEERIEVLEPEVIDVMDDSDFVESNKSTNKEKGMAVLAGMAICAAGTVAYKKVIKPGFKKLVKYVNDKMDKSEETKMISEESSKDISEEQKTK